MSQIWKYQIPAEPGHYEIDAPIGSTPINAQMQNGLVTVWFIVRYVEPIRSQTLHVVATGQTFIESQLGSHIGTVKDGPYIWHVFRSSEDQ